MAQQRLIPDPDRPVKLKHYDPNDTGGWKREDAEAEEKKLEARMADLQERLYAQGTQSLLIVLQAMDAGGKDGAIKNVFDSVNPQGVRVTSFKTPTPEELAHDFLWRVHAHVPPKGYIGIFNRSHYENVLIVRVEQLEPRSAWKRHYDEINAFEKLLSDSGTRIIKFYLHIDKAEQKKRFEERLAQPEKLWKFAEGDLKVREKWDDYMEAYGDLLTRCNTPYAPWYIVPSNHKWYRNLVITQAIVETLEDMKLRFPKAQVDPSTIVIPD